MAILFGEKTVKKFELLNEGAEVVLFGKMINSDILVDDIVDVTRKNIIRRNTNNNGGIIILSGLFIIAGAIICNNVFNKFNSKKRSQK